MLGAAVFVVLFILSLADQRLFSYMGVNTAAAADLIRKYFWQDIVFIQGKILLTYAAIGFAAGFFYYYFWLAVLGARFHGWRSRWQALLVCCSLLATEVYFLFASILNYPQVYSEYFYERSPWRRGLQVFITGHLHIVYFQIVAVVVIALFIYFLFKRLTWFSRMVIISLSVSGLVLWGLLLFIQGTYPAPSGPNVIIISADSLRNDYLTDDWAPNLSSLARKGVRFNRCFVSLPRTFPQWISYLKSQYPSQHGVRNMFPDKSLRQQEDGSLCSLLKSQGYTTAVVSDFAGDVFPRFNAGFDVVQAPYFNFNALVNQRCLEMHYLLLPYLLNNPGRRLFPVLKEMANNGDPFMLEEEAEQVLDSLRSKPKFFLVLFSSVTHFPYAAPYPYYQRYTDPHYQGAYKYYKPNIPGERLDLPAADIAQIRNLYKGAVTGFDDAAAKLLDYLRRNKLDRNTIIIVLADHGEQLYEHGWGQGHGEHLRGNAVLNVPFIFYDPREEFPVKRSDDLVRGIDLAPTILSLLKLPVPATMSGANLLPLARGDVTSLGLTAYAETGLWFTDKGDNFYQRQRIMYPDIIGLGAIDSTYNNEVIVKPEYRGLTNIAKHRMIRTADHKLIYIPTREGIQWELYDEKSDPEELRNIAAQDPKLVGELREKLFSWMSLDRDSVWRNGYLVPRP